MYEVAKYHDVNIMGVSNMLDVLANQKHKIKKIVLSSSRAIYGEENISVLITEYLS